MKSMNVKAEYVIESMRPQDWDPVRAIYEEGIETGNATFETSAPDWEKWNQSRHAKCRLVARCRNAVLGWAALTPISSRCVYEGVAEGSVYVTARHRGAGLGTALLKALVESSEENGFWTLQAMVFPENLASLTILERHGFRKVGVRERLGKLHGCWRDVLLLERRSRRVGVE